MSKARKNTHLGWIKRVSFVYDVSLLSM
jgi:hypothetical protein